MTELQEGKISDCYKHMSTLSCWNSSKWRCFSASDSSRHIRPIVAPIWQTDRWGFAAFTWNQICNQYKITLHNLQIQPFYQFHIPSPWILQKHSTVALELSPSSRDWLSVLQLLNVIISHIFIIALVCLDLLPDFVHFCIASPLNVSQALGNYWLTDMHQLMLFNLQNWQHCIADNSVSE